MNDEILNNDNILGYTEIKPVILHGRIYDKYPDFDDFVYVYSLVETHELLHKLIIEELRFYHEFVVESILSI